MNNKKQIVYAFIDSQNLNLGVRSQGWKLDWRKFRQYLRNKYNTEKAYLFIGQVPGNESLYTFLQESGYILIFKPTLERKVGTKIIIKGNVDAELVLHCAAIEFTKYNQAIIVAGDGDYHCLLEYLESQNKLFKLIIPNRYSESRLLSRFQNYKIFLYREKNNLIYTNKNGRRRA